MVKNNKQITMAWLQNRILKAKIFFGGIAIIATFVALGLLVYAMFAGLNDGLNTAIKTAGVAAIGCWVVNFVVVYAMDSAMRGK